MGPGPAPESYAELSAAALSIASRRQVRKLELTLMGGDNIDHYLFSIRLCIIIG
jgi:hypothetical protein